MALNPERVRRLANPFRVNTKNYWRSQGSRSSNPGLKLANAFGVQELNATPSAFKNRTRRLRRSRTERDAFGVQELNATPSAFKN